MKIPRLRLMSFLFSMILIVSITPTYAQNQNVTQLLDKGRAAITSYQFDKAIPYYDKVLEIDPNNRVALINKGVALANLHKYNDAMSYFDKVIKIYPNDIDALNNKAAALLKLERYDDAMYYFDKILKLQPGNTVAASNKKEMLNREPLDTHSNKYIARLSIISEIQIRNSEGHLVGYIEPSRIRVPDPDFLGIILDTSSIGKFNINGSFSEVKKSVIKKNGQRYEETTIISDRMYRGDDTVASKTGYMQGNAWIYVADHNGYQLVDGDHLVLKWKILKLIS